MKLIYVITLPILITAITAIGCSTNKNSSGQSASGGATKGQSGKGGAAAGQAGGSVVDGSQTGSAGRVTSTGEVGGFSGANDSGTPNLDTPDLVNTGESCSPTLNSTNGGVLGFGHAWTVKNVGSSGTINITVSVTGEPDAGISGEPDVTKQFAVLAGTSYILSVGFPVRPVYDRVGNNIYSTNPSYCVYISPRTINSDFGYSCGPLVKVTIPGTSSDAFSFIADAYGAETTTSATGEPMIALEEGSSISPNGKLNCPFPDGG